jgi:TPR repeat protein
MIHPVSVLKGLPTRSALAALGLAFALTLPASAAQVKVDFLPPEIPSQAICTAKPLDADIRARWDNWDGATLPSQDPDAILKDGRRLRDLDASRYFDTVNKMLTAVSTMPGQAKLPDTNIDRINLYLKAGKVAQLRELGLIDKLMADETTLAPKALNVLSGLYLNGIAVKKDRERGLELAVRSAMGGNADALLMLASANLAGQQIPGWDLDPKLAITMAFGALVGKLDPDICDRIGRIAREYGKGEVVQQDYQASEAWFRLAADLGDPGAAWKVAGMHLASEQIVKNNATLIKYMTQAAEGGVVAAQLELGKAYEVGALVPADAAKAEHYYSTAADKGNRGATMRLVTLLEPQILDPKQRARYKSLLERLTSAPDAPGQSFSKLAELVLDEKGRWAGEPDAQALLEKGVARGDGDSAQLLAGVLLRHRDEPGAFERATELLANAVTNTGKINPMTDLRNSYLCLAPTGVNARLSDFWALNEETAGNSTRYLKPDEINALATSGDPLARATLQTQALYGRPNSLAYYLYYLDQTKADPLEKAFWRQRRDTSVAAVDADARYALEKGITPQVLEQTVAMLEKAKAGGLPRASLDLASVLLDYFPNDPVRVEQATGYLKEAAAKGYGDALNRLLFIGQENGVTKTALYNEYATAIDERGDADALIFATSVIEDPAKRTDYLERAASVMDCEFNSTLKLAGAYASLDAVPKAEHWLDVSLHLASADGWRNAAVADQYVALKGDDHLTTAISLYEKGVALGDTTSIGRLVKIYSEPDTIGYAPKKAVDMFRTLIASADVSQLKDIRQRVMNAPAVIRNNVLADVSWDGLYKKAAEAGNVIAMRELAFYLQENGTKPSDVADASHWLKLAADGGDADAMVALAKAYAMGIGIAPSIEQATLLLKEAAGTGNAEAQKLLAGMTTPVEN